jgi:hypothetical protein
VVVVQGDQHLLRKKLKPKKNKKQIQKSVTPKKITCDMIKSICESDQQGKVLPKPTCQRYTATTTDSKSLL